MKKLNIVDVHTNFIKDILKKEMLQDRVLVSKHFCERIVERNVDMHDVIRAIRKLIDTVCLTLYRFESGEKVQIKTQDNLVLKMDYFDGVIILMTCYYKGVY